MLDVMWQGPEFSSFVQDLLGRIGSSTSRHSIPMKAIKRMIPENSIPITIGEVHANVDPP